MAEQQFVSRKIVTVPANDSDYPAPADAAPAAPPPPLSLTIVLGDGNFSFSLAFLRQIVSISASHFENRYFFLTSFDSREEVLRKYPESLSILNEIKKFANAAVYHSIDATKDFREQLVQAGENIFENRHFIETIIFNFPHLGQENARLHSSLLAHVMSCCCNLLEGSDSTSLFCCRWQMSRQSGGKW